MIAASTYENGYGSVGTPDDQQDRPGADSASVLSSNSPAAAQPFYQSPPPVTAPGAELLMVVPALEHDVDVSRKALQYRVS